MIVYWFYDASCTDPYLHGYIGITNNLRRRLYEHKSNPRLPVKFDIKILLEGTVEECKSFERKLRPEANIGWNIVPGGGIPPSQKGRKRSAATRAKMARPLSDEIKKKIGDANRGKPKTLTEEQRELRRKQAKSLHFPCTSTTNEFLDLLSPITR